MHLQRSAYRRDFDEATYVPFLIKNNEMLEKYNKIWDKVSKFNNKYLKIQIKSCEEKINTDFHDDEVPKEDSQYICVSVILVDSVFRTDKNYYPHVFLEKFKYVSKEKKINKYIIERYINFFG